MIIGVNCGHTICGAGGGANGLIKESDATRLVGNALMKKLKDTGIGVVDCTINKAATQEEYLTAVTALANREDLDWFISIHFNASINHTAQGVEIYTYKGRQYQDAMDICENISKLGFRNRGIKNGSNLYVIRKTKAKSMLIEVCFCDSQNDVEIYKCVGAEEAIAQAIFNGLYKYAMKVEVATENEEISSFEDFVGNVAKADWQDRRIMLPSVVVAQAMKESARGKSELAREANALFGIRKNGWVGRTYIKNAIEQRQDGSFFTVEKTEWRAYDNWEQSILDHNTYIATRTMGDGRTLRYAPLIGCDNYVLVCQYLQECGYATSRDYTQSLISDYIEKYNLTRFD